MDKVKIMYLLNGSVKFDILTGTQVSINRTEASVSIDFPNADGQYLTRHSKEVSGEQDPITWISYRKADWVARYRVESDTSPGVS